MIKSELIQKIADQLSHLPEKQIAEAVNFILNTMGETLTEGQRIEIRGFGSFSVHYHPPRLAHNPKTGEKLTTEGKYSPHFKSGKALKELVNQSEKK
jgi:integration host factor subunit beta